MAEDIRNAKMMPLRIFVGGLGESIVENEVSRIFESVGGVVEGVELVRTKGRSFAYVDFLPSSDKSLSKLFGTVLASSFLLLFLFSFFLFLCYTIIPKEFNQKIHICNMR